MDKGFWEGILGSFLDFSFSEFVTTRLIKVLYILGIACAVIMGLSMIISGFGNGFGTGILSLILSPIAVVLAILAVRIYLELLIVLFRIAENTSDLVKLQKPEAPAADDLA
ncbi:MAG: DUF4282 domain-containing protein [Syntrophotaleaceae bacterium]